ncbi:MAG: OmpA family protein [Alphaproteobacteria bacterium]|nr:OmpA family protein [Alphaproteobacteria bacterium]
MTLSAKTIALSAVIALGSMMSTSAHASILLTNGGAPVMTKDGAPVYVKDAGCPELSMAAVAEKAHEAVYFDFNKSTLSRHARKTLSRMASKLNGQGSTVAVVGFADRMGNAAYNERLALKRAKAVRDYLVAKGVKAKKIEVRSLGKSAPKTDCAEAMVRKELIACLREDRRVEIEVR